MIPGVVPGGLHDRFQVAVKARQWERALAFCDRNAGPYLLDEWRDELPVADLRVVVPHVWQMAEYPVGDVLDQGDWLDLWRRIGFVSTAGNPPPERPLTAYRGAPKDGGELGLSWTSDPGVAQWFAQRWEQSGVDAIVYSLEVPPHAVLALIDSDDNRQEHEVVVDVRRLRDLKGSV